MTIFLKGEDTFTKHFPLKLATMADMLYESVSLGCEIKDDHLFWVNRAKKIQKYKKNNEYVLYTLLLIYAVSANISPLLFVN